MVGRARSSTRSKSLEKGATPVLQLAARNVQRGPEEFSHRDDLGDVWPDTVRIRVDQLVIDLPKFRAVDGRETVGADVPAGEVDRDDLELGGLQRDIDCSLDLGATRGSEASHDSCRFRAG
jgi:hypothetical protein